MATSNERIRTIVAREENLPLAPSGTSTEKRSIPSNHDFDPKALRPLARTLFSTSVALGHAVKAYKEFARIKSVSISPDGLLGGKGYILSVKDIRLNLVQVCELLSALTDTLHDEVNGSHWKPRIADLGPSEAEDITDLLQESDEVLQDPESFGSKEIEEVEAKTVPKTKQLQDHIKDQEESQHTSDASNIPGPGSDTEAKPPKVKQAKWKAPSAWGHYANSSLPVTTLPGPRVDHLDRGDQTGPQGSYNQDEPRVEDGYGLHDGGRPKSQNVVSESLTPNDPDTRTEADDFGLGYGAKGQASNGYGTRNPDGRGVFGPQSGLPYDPGGTTKDVGEVPMGMRVSDSQLPFDGPDSVARSDYYDGDKGNNFNTNRERFSDSQLPNDGGDTSYDYSRDISPNTGDVHEQQGVPYVKRDWTTHSDRNDQQDLYQRGR